MNEPSASGSEGLLGARRIGELLQRHGVKLTKTLGQNFVIDPNTIRKMVDVAAVEPDDHVLEIGAGAGSLTLALAGAAAHVTAVEVDDRLLDVLAETVGDLANVSVIHADALELDYPSVAATSLVGNLPYNIAATVVVDALQKGASISRMTVMTQREVAERLAASPGSKIYGQSSVLVAFHGTARVAARVSRNAFYPVPNVDSAIVTIDRHRAPDVDPVVFKEIVRTAFGQRRKMIRSSLVALAGSPEAALALCEAAGIEPTSRPEVLDVNDFVQLTSAHLRRQR